MTQENKVAELLTTRYKVIAGWPSHFYNPRIGTIQAGETGSTVDDGFIFEYKNYPHLFKKLEWWEDRKPEEMPEYVKESEGTEHGSIVYVHKVKQHYTHGGACCLCGVGINNHYCYLQPATKSEYDQYIKQNL